MGKASSSKKVARAAKAAGRPGTGRSWGWPALISGLVVLGLVLIVISRGQTEDAVAPKLGDHWHAAYAIYSCDTFLPPLTDTVADETGLHTHGDGLMHLHPFGTSYTGENANIENWGLTTGLELSDDSFTAGAVERKNGDECDGGAKGTVQLKVWDSPDDTEGRILEGDFADYAPQEFSMWVLAFVPEGTEIPKPPQQVIETLRAPDDGAPGEGSVPPQTAPAGTVPLESTTVPGSAETTVAPTDTSVPADTTPTTAAPGTTATSAP